MCFTRVIRSDVALKIGTFFFHKKQKRMATDIYYIFTYPTSSKKVAIENASTFKVVIVLLFSMVYSYNEYDTWRHTAMFAFYSYLRCTTLIFIFVTIVMCTFTIIILGMISEASYNHIISEHNNRLMDMNAVVFVISAILSQSVFVFRIIFLPINSRLDPENVINAMSDGVLAAYFVIFSLTSIFNSYILSLKAKTLLMFIHREMTTSKVIPLKRNVPVSKRATTTARA